MNFRGKMLGKKRVLGRFGVLTGFAGFVGLGLLGFSIPAQAVPANQAPVYAIDNYPFQKAPALKRWRSVLQREAHLTERANPDDCNDGKPRLACAAKDAQRLEEALKDKSPAEQVAGVYAYFNAIKWREHDPQSCGIDCWKSRLQFLAQREGDCGDHAIAEYFTLKRLGFKDRDLQLIVAQLPGFEDSFKGGHVVLRVRADGDYYVLDNRRTLLTNLSGLKSYKVLAGLNAESVQIYNLVTDEPPPGVVADASRYIASPGAQQEAAAPTPILVAEAPDVPQQPELSPASTFSTQSATMVVAAAEPATAEPAAKTDDEASTMCVQTARLADWNPFLPCTPVTVHKMVVKAKTIIGATPPTEIAEAPKAPEPAIAAPKVTEPKITEPEITEPKLAEAKVMAPKAPEPEAAQPKVASKPVTVATPEPSPVPSPPPVQAAEADQAEDDSGSCIQGARLADWNPDLPCAENGDASSLRIQFSD